MFIRHAQDSSAWKLTFWPGTKIDFAFATAEMSDVDYFSVLFERNLLDVLETILVRMMDSFRDIHSCTQVCKRWRHFLLDEGGQILPSTRKLFKTLTVPWIWTHAKPEEIEIPIPEELMNEGEADILYGGMTLNDDFLLIFRGFKCVKINRKTFPHKVEVSDVKTLQCDSLSKPQYTCIR